MYKTGLVSYKRFCEKGWKEIPASEDGLSLFMAHLSLAELSAQTAQVNLASVWLQHLQLGTDTSVFQQPHLATAVQVLHHGRAAQGTIL